MAASTSRTGVAVLAAALTASLLLNGVFVISRAAEPRSQFVSPASPQEVDVADASEHVVEMVHKLFPSARIESVYYQPTFESYDIYFRPHHGTRWMISVPPDGGTIMLMTDLEDGSNGSD